MILLLALFGVMTPAAPAPVAPAIRSVTASPTATGVVITVQLTGPAAPSAGKLIDNPSRLYFDLPGVTAGAQRMLAVENGSISHVRIGMNRPAPPVTRVVIELSGKVKWKIEPGASASEVRVTLDEVAPRPAPRGPGGRVIYQPVPAPAPAPAVDRRAQMTSDLWMMAPALDAMAAWTGPGDAELATLIASAERLSAEARALRMTGLPADLALGAAADALLTACRARAQALADGTPQSRANAITAARGALLLVSEVRQVT